MESLLPKSAHEIFTHRQATKPSKVLSRVATLFFLTLLFAKVPAQLAPINPPAGGFRIDGGLKANTPTANQGDWIFGPGGTGDSVLRYNGTPFNSATTGLKRDLYNSSSDSVFAQGSKFNDYISSLHWTASTAPNKNDINNAMYHVATASNGDQWIIIAGDRLSTDGTSYIDFEFLQDTVKVNPNGTFTGTGPAGGRTVGDLIASIEYNNGGSTANVIFYKWVLKSGTYQYDSTGSASISAAGNAFAITNDVNQDVPFQAFGSSTYIPFSFVEAAVNVTQLLNALGGSNCAGLKIKTLWIKTKASSVTNAALKDFVTPIPVSFTFGGVSIDAKGPVCVDGSPITLTGSPAGGVFSSPDPGVSGNTFTPSVAGVGTHKIYYTASVGLSCTKKDSMNIIVNAKPTVTVNSPTKCANDPNVTITATPGNGSASDYDYAWTVPGGATAPGNVQSFSTSVAGTYSVVITNKTTTCTSLSGSGTLTVNPNPTVSVNSPTKCANDPAVTITATPGSGSASDYNYSWTVPLGAAAPGNVQSFSATVGGTYSVIITNKTTNCASASGSGTLTVNANPTITGPAIAAVCAGATSASVSYTGTTAGANQYRIDWDATANTAGLVDINYTNLPASPFNITIPGTLAVGTYNGTIYFKNTTTGCESTGSAISLTVNANPTASAGSAPASQCFDAGGNTFNLTGTGSNGSPSWAVQSNLNSLTVQITNGNTLTPSVKVTGSGSVTLRLTVTSTSCGGATSDVTVTVKPLPPTPIVTYHAPACDESTFSVTVSSVEAGASYTILDKNLDPIPGVSPSSPHIAPDNNDFNFSNIPAGSGYSVTVIGANGCAPNNAPATCGTADINKASVLVHENLESQTTVKAYPNPFSDKIKFVVTSPVGGRGNLDVYNMMGQRIKTVYQGYISSGTQTFEMSLPTQQIANLVYVLRIGDKRISGKIFQITQ